MALGYDTSSLPRAAQQANACWRAADLADQPCYPPALPLGVWPTPSMQTPARSQGSTSGEGHASGGEAILLSACNLTRRLTASGARGTSVASCSMWKQVTCLFSLARAVL